jgi:hypothetical protein
LKEDGEDVRKEDDQLVVCRLDKQQNKWLYSTRLPLLIQISDTHTH